MPLPIPTPPAGGPGPPPPGLAGATGAAAAPGALAGSAAQGMAGLKVGLEALQKALPQLPMGSEIHTSVLKAIADISKHMEKGGQGQGDSSAVIQQLVEAARMAKTQPNMAAMMPPPAGGAMPPPPPPGAGAPPPPMM